MKTIKVAWCSRHPLSQEQRESLVNKLGGDVRLVEYAVEQRNITWQATTDRGDDDAHNFSVWSDLTEEFNIIAGVFPPVALASRPEYSGPIYAPVSIQSEARVTGSTKTVEFKHAYWVEID